jgi:channel protein (hemolysin III family)
MDAELRPRLRGVFHQWAFVAAVAAGVVLVVLSDGWLATFSSWVYAAALVAMFGASALYHRFPWKSAAKRLWARRLDHSMIFVFIAGSYTPFALLCFEGTTQWLVLVTVWLGAAFGLTLELVWIDSPRWLSAVAYIAVGWVGVHRRRAHLRGEVAEPVPAHPGLPRDLPPARRGGRGHAVRCCLPGRAVTRPTGARRAPSPCAPAGSRADARRTAVRRSRIPTETASAAPMTAVPSAIRHRSPLVTWPGVNHRSHIDPQAQASRGRARASGTMSRAK